MEENIASLPLLEIKKRIIPSFVSLSIRQIALRAIGFISINIILAKILSVETLGIFNIATSIVNFFFFFSDIGLAASLIQKKSDVNHLDIKTSFTIQQILVTILSILIILGAPILGQFYKLGPDGIWLIRVLGISFFLSSLKVIPSVLLERELKFHILVIVEVAEALIFNTLLIVLAYERQGIWSFSVATLAQGLTGVILIYALAPVKVGFGISKQAARELLSFGIPYQLNSLLALLKDQLVPLVVAKIVGPLGIGYITWAQALAFLPLEVMNIIIRITFPAFSRIQDDKIALSQAVEKSLFITSLAVYPLLFGLGAIMPSVVAYVVSSKWQPSLESFYLFAFSALWAVISTTLTNTLNSIGHIKTTLYLMILWTALTWVLTPILVLTYGFVGVSMAAFLISFTSFITIIVVKRILVIKVLDAILLPTLAAMFMGIVVFFFSQAFVKDKITLGIAIILGAAIYGLIIYLFARKKLLLDLQALRS